MKKLLTRIFSVVLMAATVASPSMAQLAKKASASNSKTKQSIAVQAAPAGANKSPIKGEKDFMVPQTRPLANSIASSARVTATSIATPRSVKAPAKSATDLPTINGCVIYQDSWTSSEVGLYTLNTSTKSMDLFFDGVDASAGGICIGQTYYAVNNFELFGMTFIYADMYDLVDQEELGSKSLSDVQFMAPGGFAQDPTTGEIYGCTYNSAGNALQLTKIEFDPNWTATAVAALSGNWNCIFFDNTGQLYGISQSVSGQVVVGSTLNKIDKETGAVTPVGETGAQPQYISSAVCDKNTGRVFWNVCTPDDTAYLYEINLLTGEATVVFQMEDGAEIMGMYIPEPLAAEDAPAVCENVEAVFPDGSLVGSINLTAPSSLYGGASASGNVTIVVLANGEEIATANTTYGEETVVPVDLTESGAGNYTFTVYARNAAGDGPTSKVKNIWVGADTPSATSANLVYENGNMEVSWNAVTSSINGGYVDFDNLTYKVVRADGSVAAEGLTVTEFSEAVSEPTELTSYYYVVYAVAGDQVSAGAKTNVVTLGSIVPPYTSDFGANGLSGWTVVDANDDGKTWSAYGDEARCQYNGQNEMDDWLYSPALKLEGGKQYELTFATRAQSVSYPERIEVKFGQEMSAEGMTTTLLEATDVVTTDPVNHKITLNPETDGLYYIGFHGISDKNMYYLYISNITVEAGVYPQAPGLATDIQLTADQSGALSMSGSFKAPAVAVDGSSLNSLDKVEVIRGGEVIKTFNAPAPGATLSFDDTLTTGGDTQYSFVAYNSYGAGLKAVANVFVGYNKPASLPAAHIKRTSTPGEAIVTWTPVTQDIDGKTYPDGAVKYKICTYETSGWVPFTDYLDGTSYTYQAVEAGEQEFVQVAVFPFYDGINGTGAASEFMPFGTPYDGLDETVADGQLHYQWAYSTAPTQYGLGGGTPNVCTAETFTGTNGVNDDNGYLNFQTPTYDSSLMWYTAMVSLNGIDNPGFTFYIYNINNGEKADINLVNVYVQEVGDEDGDWTLLYSKPVNEACGANDPTELGVDGWNKIIVGLGEYSNKTVMVAVEAVCKLYQNNFFDNLYVGEILAHDLKASSISAPSKVKPGADYDVTVTVSNEGAQAAENYSVELYADEELVATKDCSSLASGSSSVVTFECTMSPLAQEAITYYAKVVYAEDENMSNNQTESVIVNPVISTLPAATNLKGESVEEGVKLTWNEPNLENGPANAAPAPVTDDFEDADAFAAEYGDWTFVDLDESEVGGFQGTDLPGITPGGTLGSFWAWDTDIVASDNPTFAAHSGTKYLFALFRYDGGTTNDWAISPKLYGGEQTVSFYAKSYSSNYPEKVRVLYTTEDSTNPEDYTEVVLTIDPVAGDWTLYEAELPAGALHFAINSCATDSFMLMVDDVTYIPGDGTGAQLELEGYNVYRDGVKINDALVEETEFIDTNVVEGEEYTYIVTAVYADRGESALSNEVTVLYKPEGIDSIANGAVTVKVEGSNIVVLNAEGQNVTVSSVNGMVLFNGAGEPKTVVNVATGVYVVKAGNVVKKVSVK